MAIIDLQRRYTEIGRIRMGDRKVDPKRPGAKLATWRLSSNNRAVLEEAAALWGGTPREWAEAPTEGQWDIITESDSLPIVIAPGPEPVSQWFEQWNRGGATHRCDGRTNVITDTPCSCDPAKRDCKATTRVNVMLPDLPGLGVWRLETHGYYAATELPMTIEFIRTAAVRGQMLPGTLRIEQRQRVAGGTTMRFAVAVIDLDVTVRQLAAGAPGTSLPTPSREQMAITSGNVTPIEREPAPPIADQIDSVNEERPRKPRSNAAAQVPPTGMIPRPVASVRTEPTGAAGISSSGDDAGAVPPGRDESPPPAEDPPASGSHGSGPLITTDQRRLLFASGRGQGLSEQEIRDVVEQVTGQTSTRGMTSAQLDDVLDALPAAAQTTAVEDDPSLTDWRAEI